MASHAQEAREVQMSEGMPPQTLQRPLPPLPEAQESPAVPVASVQSSENGFPHHLHPLHVSLESPAYKRTPVLWDPAIPMTSQLHYCKAQSQSISRDLASKATLVGHR